MIRFLSLSGLNYLYLPLLTEEGIWKVGRMLVDVQKDF